MLEWPSLLALDAPIVVGSWYTLGSSLFDRFRFSALVVLMAAVWLTYAADRFFDALTVEHRTGRPSVRGLARRHRVAGTCRGWWLAAWGLVLAMALIVAAHWLSEWELRAGLALLAAAVLYLAAAQAPPSWRRLLPKEPIVAVLLVCAIWLFVGSGVPFADAVMFLSGSAWLFCIDCGIVSWWERTRDLEVGLATDSGAWWSRGSLLTALALLASLVLVGSAARRIGPAGLHTDARLLVALALGGLWLLFLVLRSQRDGPPVWGRAAIDLGLGCCALLPLLFA